MNSHHLTQTPMKKPRKPLNHIFGWFQLKEEFDGLPRGQIALLMALSETEREGYFAIPDGTNRQIPWKYVEKTKLVEEDDEMIICPGCAIEFNINDSVHPIKNAEGSE